MISLELAEELKNCGLEWEYEYGFPRDCVYYKGKLHGVDGTGAGDTIRIAPWQNYVKRENLIFAPTLTQILSEIEKRGYAGWCLSQDNLDDYQLDLIIDQQVHAVVHGNSPEEAAAAALLWVMKEGKA